MAAKPAFTKVQMAVAAFGVFSLFGHVFQKDPVQVHSRPPSSHRLRCLFFELGGSASSGALATNPTNGSVATAAEDRSRLCRPFSARLGRPQQSRSRHSMMPVSAL